MKKIQLTPVLLLLVAALTTHSVWAGDAISIVGAKTLCSPLKEQAAALSQVVGSPLTVQDQGGSEEAIKQVYMGKADAACVVRNLTDQEKNAMEQKVVALDILIAVVKKELPIDAVTKENIKLAFSQDKKSWKELNPAFPDIPLEPVTTRKVTATEKNIQKLFLDGGDFRPQTLEVDTMSSAPKLLQNRKELGAISIMSRSFFKGYEASLKILSIDGVLPSPATIQDGSYPYGRPVSLVYKKGSARQGDLDKLAAHVNGQVNEFFKGEMMPAQ
ncbi:MAG: hypothetical protein G8345_08195 [Magnetococcales bacterium]|nr:substrate-binding domain-containing protein [Magnetococcales bacterium]NGZ26855.1 hypothetical protein [Magnetococcales bacterium]